MSDRVQSINDLQVGSVIYVEMDKNDGIVLKDGYTTRLKYVVVAGAKSNKKEVGVLLINSNADYSSDSDWISNQYPLKQSNYSNFLDRDSWIDCTDPKEITLRKMKAKKAIKVGILTDDDMKAVQQIVKDSDFIDEHFKKVYGIKIGSAVSRQ